METGWEEEEKAGVGWEAGVVAGWEKAEVGLGVVVAMVAATPEDLAAAAGLVAGWEEEEKAGAV